MGAKLENKKKELITEKSYKLTDIKTIVLISMFLLSVVTINTTISYYLVEANKHEVTEKEVLSIVSDLNKILKMVEELERQHADFYIHINKNNHLQTKRFDQVVLQMLEISIGKAKEKSKNKEK